MRKYVYPILAVLVIVVLYYGEQYANKTTENYPDFTANDSDVTSEEFQGNWLPTSTSGTVITHNFFTLSYVEKHEQAEWVAYPLLKQHLSKNDFERPDFIEDRKIKSKSADWRSYKNSGFDRGHLCPAGDRRFSVEAYHETFLTSNISPQNRDFNGGVWNNLEQQTRYWAKKYDGVYVISGGVLTDDLKSIGFEKVSIPEYFFKIVVDNTEAKPKAIAFLIPNKPTNNSFYKYVTSIDQIEELTKIDFFPNLDFDAELESTIQIEKWRNKK